MLDVHEPTGVIMSLAMEQSLHCTILICTPNNYIRVNGHFILDGKDAV